MPPNLVWSLFWLVQVNLLAWLVAAVASGFQSVPILIGLAFGTALEHLHVRRIHPRLRSLSTKRRRVREAVERHEAASGPV